MRQRLARYLLPLWTLAERARDLVLAGILKMIGKRNVSLRELRTFRRITGETMHMAVELDCLRALGRDGDIGKTFELFLELGGDRDAEDEARVVYASHLLDQGRIADAWRVIKPGRLVNRAPAAALRRWAVAARVAAASGDAEAAGKILSAIRREDSDLEWLPELERELGL